jgi:hypothetical protein
MLLLSRLTIVWKSHKIQSRIKEKGRRSSHCTEVTHADGNNVSTVQGGGKRLSTDLWRMWSGDKAPGQATLLQPLP